ncbi:hypothetical protein [Streptomyces sp. NPDC001903]|uniref:hypothetical protein n=1 Tax=Streptomyces sp. NPDC001903 TaxID=3364622 RepID=UPI0036A0C4FC
MITAKHGGGPHGGTPRADESCAERTVRTQGMDTEAVESVARAAFRARFEPAYRQFAVVSLRDEGAGADVAAAVWTQIEQDWAGLLACASTAGCAWQRLSSAVHNHPRRPRSALDELPRPAADAFLLRHRVGLEADRAAEAMGMESAAFESLYRTVVPRPAA